MKEDELNLLVNKIFKITIGYLDKNKARKIKELIREAIKN